MQAVVRDLNRVYRETPALWARDLDPGGFEWIDANDAGGNTFSFLRWDDQGGALACIVNFSAIPHHGYRIGLPFAGRWDEVLNTDADVYCGSGVGNFGAVEATDEAVARAAGVGDGAGPSARHGLAALDASLSPSLLRVRGNGPVLRP